MTGLIVVKLYKSDKGAARLDRTELGYYGRNEAQLMRWTGRKKNHGSKVNLTRLGHADEARR